MDDVPRDVGGRPLRLRAVDLDTFLHPRSIAVVGASEARGRPNSLMTARIKSFADDRGARFHPVTPAYPTVLGVPTVAEIADVDDEIDLAVLLTGAERVVDHFAAAVECGAKFAVIFAAGFAETGSEGARLEERLRALATSGATRLLGPNTNLNAFSEFRGDLEGPAIALITQSGHQGRPVFQGQELGIRLSHWAPTGNEVDLEFADWCRYFADQPEVGVIAAYIEGFKDGRTLMLAADHAARTATPIVIVKVGRTAAGASMALSHTGHLTGSDAVIDAVFRQFGIVRVDGLDELLDVSATFARTTRPRSFAASAAGGGSLPTAPPNSPAAAGPVTAGHPPAVLASAPGGGTLPTAPPPTTPNAPAPAAAGPVTAGHPPAVLASAPGGGSLPSAPPAAALRSARPPRASERRAANETQNDEQPNAVEASLAGAASLRARPGICVYSISGGTGAHLADMAAAAGLYLPELSESTQRALHDGLIPPYLRVSNPVDCGGPPVMDERGREILDVLVGAPEVDALIVPITGALDSMSDPLARDLVAVAATTDKPLFVVWGSPVGDERAYRESLLGSRLPVYRTFQNCVRAVKAWQDWWAFVDSYESPFGGVRASAVRAASAARRIVADAPAGRTLSEFESKRVLRAYGIRTTRDELCGSAVEAVRAAAARGFPVVMKVCSPDLAHKTESGLVALGVGSAAAVRRTYDELVARARRANRRARIDGVLVCETIAPRGRSRDVETLVGVSHDELFGPVVSVGLGGVLVEVLGDVSVRVPPFGEAEAHRMIDELAGRSLLRGVRGAGAVDEDALVGVIMKVQRLALDLADLVAEVDINPLVVRRRGVIALDALVVRRT